MSIRLKLIILVLVTSLAGASSIFVNQLIMSPVQRIDVEYSLLQNLRFSLIDYINKLNQLDIQDFRYQLKETEVARKDLDAAFMQVKELKFLPSVNDSIKSSIGKITLFSTSLNMTQKSFDDIISNVINIAEKYTGSDGDFSIFKLAWGLEETSDEETEEINYAVFLMTSGVVRLNKNITTILNDIDSQYIIINNEIAKYKRRAERTLVLILILIIVVPLIIALLIANMLADRIRRIEIGISRMKDGDLADRINVKGSDEMGRLSSNVNQFTDALGLSIMQIQEASRINLDVKESLCSSVERVSTTTDEAANSAQSIASEMIRLDETVKVTEQAVGTVEDQLNRLEFVINEQVSMIEEATASISEMITSVNSVTEITVKKKAALTNLVEYSTEGGAKLTETNRVVAAVHDSIEEIQGTAKIIANIASQTNLLAMNAAIEAAHAGDAGRGFAVVSDEIRKLAEATSSNSKRIGGVMKVIISNIEEAVESAQSTGSVFKRIDREVSEASASFDEISQSMEELRIGGTQILEAMSRLNDISNQVQEGDASIREAAAANRSSVENAEKISKITVEQVKGITKALEILVREMEAVTAVTEKADAISRTIESEVEKFTISESLLDE